MVVITKKSIDPRKMVEAANRRFESLLPELESRCRRIATRYPRNMRRDVANDALSFCYRNHLSCYARGKRPSAADLAFYAVRHVRYRSLETRPGYPSRRQREHVRLYDCWIEDPAPEVAKALATAERDDPAERARIAIDWQAFAAAQDCRTQRILYGLSIGESKRGIAAKLNITQGRLSQLLDRLAGEVTAFYHGDVGIPDEARRAGRC